MIIERNKALTRKYFQHYTAQELDELFAMLAEDCVWWVAGRPHQFLSSGVYDKPAIEAAIRNFFFGQIMTNGIVFTITSLVAEGDRVTAEVDAKALTSAGVDYDQNFHFVIQYNDEGKIILFKEYLDTLLAREAFEGIPANHPDVPDKAS